ncbi:MAG: hypothetical protein QOC99_302 [Acidobacteriota bacterium]|nr:hypothetical protein [Acidobacteriota bacterium]MDT7777790.1 hypothetical protein [Acidobacteriota bacterium]
MKVLRFIRCVVPLSTLLWCALPARLSAQQQASEYIPEGLKAVQLPLRRPALPDINPATFFSPHRPTEAIDSARGGVEPGSSVGGIKEIIPDKYAERYLYWKNEFLSTESGRAQWELYNGRAHFILTITVTCDNPKGAGTGKFKWDDSGELIAATITLGCRIDEGYPKPIFYPVMSSLDPGDSSLAVDKNVLAAAKIAHEFGHVKHVTGVDGVLYRLQNKLTPLYNKILLGNGRNTNDPRLLELERQMNGTPVKIQQERELWGEANAMLYLRERITDGREQRALFNRIVRNVELYASDYVDRFESATK